MIRPERAIDFLTPLPVGRLPGVGRVGEQRLRAAGFDVREEPFERPRHVGEVEALGQQAGILDLSAGPGAQEASDLRLRAAAPLGRLLLERTQRPEFSGGVDGLLHGGHAQGANQLVLEVGRADEDTMSLQVVGRGQALVA